MSIFVDCEAKISSILSYFILFNKTLSKIKLTLSKWIFQKTPVQTPSKTLGFIEYCKINLKILNNEVK